MRFSCEDSVLGHYEKIQTSNPPGSKNRSVLVRITDYQQSKLTFIYLGRKKLAGYRVAFRVRAGNQACVGTNIKTGSALGVWAWDSALALSPQQLLCWPCHPKAAAVPVRNPWPNRARVAGGDLLVLSCLQR